MTVAHLDYEGRSGVDIGDVGSYRWSIDPRFEIFMASVSMDDSDEVFLWVNPKLGLGFSSDSWEDNKQAERILAKADIIYAHNAPNEIANTWGALTQGKACPFTVEPPLTKWRCTAAMARKAGLPFSLEKVSEALNLPVKKDPKGKALIKFFCIPDEETGAFNEPKDHPAKWAEFCSYCVTDNLAEKGVHRKLKPFELTGSALETFQFDLRMNFRGVPINLTAARNAQTVIDLEQSGVTAEFKALTGLNVTQREKVRVLLDMPNMQGPVVEAEIDRLEMVLQEDDLMGAADPADLRKQKLLRMYQKVSYAAVKKVSKMIDCACPDGRVRGMFMYYGAGTGRWSAGLLQPHNFKKLGKEWREVAPGIYEAICAGRNSNFLQELYGDPLECIANVIRQFIQGPSDMLDGDFAQVEARIICWLAGQSDVLEMWRAGRDLYKWMAAHTYGVPESEVDADQREVGKRIILGAGFQMGPTKFKDSCLKQYQLDVPLDLCEKGIKMFRTLCKKIVAYWYYLNDCAKNAVRSPGSTSGPFSTRNIAGMPYLLFRIRSGRSLAYPQPKIELLPYTPKNAPPNHSDTLDENWEPRELEEQFRENVTYWGQLPMSQQWGRVKLYGGKLAENETQATAADFMAHGAIVAESRGMEPFMLVHDQGLALRNNGQTTKEYEAALGDLPAWAKGFPMRVEAKISPYYKK